MKKTTGKSGADGEKAQGGKKVYLRRGQLKRIGRLSAKNPDRAERVTKRIVERATRSDRGKEYIQKNMTKLRPEVPEVGGMRKGGKIKKARSGATLSPSSSSTSTRLSTYGRTIGKNTSGGTKKCKYGC
jgi:hypothetical protein